MSKREAYRHVCIKPHPALQFRFQSVDFLQRFCICNCSLGYHALSTQKNCCSAEVLKAHSVCADALYIHIIANMRVVLECEHRRQIASKLPCPDVLGHECICTCVTKHAGYFTAENCEMSHLLCRSREAYRTVSTCLTLILTISSAVCFGFSTFSPSTPSANSFAASSRSCTNQVMV